MLHTSEKIAVTATGVFTILCCIGFAAITVYFVEPYLADIYAGFSETGAMLPDNILMIAIMFVILAVLVLAAHFGSVSGKTLPPYLCGRGVDENGRFHGSLGVYKEAKSSNYYMEEYCGEAVLIKPAWIISILLIIVMFALAFLGVMI